MGKQHNRDDDDDGNVESEEISVEDVEEEPNEEETSEVEQYEEESCEESSNEGEEPCEEDPSEEGEPCEEEAPSEEEEPCEEEEEEPCEEEDPCEEKGPYEYDPTEDEPCAEATEETGEEPIEEEVSELAHSSSDSNDGEEHQLNSTPSGSDKKRSPDRLECDAQKKQKLDLNSNPDIPNNLIECVVVLENQETIASSSKKRPSRWDTNPKDGRESVDSGDMAAKKRKTRWGSDDTQLKLLGPLKLPDFMKGIVSESNLDPESLKLKMQLWEINEKLMAREIPDNRPEKERSPPPPPIYDNQGININTREARIRAELIEQRQKIISDLIQKNPTFKPPLDLKPPKLFKKLYIPLKEYPGYNFIGLVMGPRGRTQKRMEKETGASILLRGKGAKKNEEAQLLRDDQEDLHVRIEATTQESLDAAVSMVEKLLVPVEEGKNEHKRAQLKELAETIIEEKVQKITSKTKGPCGICGDVSHLTAACPLTAPTHQADSLTKLGTGLFSPFAAPPVPTPAVPWLVNPAPGALQPFNTMPLTSNKVDESNLYVGYLPLSVDENKLIELFSPFGQISEVKVIKDKSTSVSKGYGFVKYVDAIFAAEAVARMNGYTFEGHTIAVRVAGRHSYTVNANSVLGAPQGFAYLPAYPGPVAVPQLQGSPNFPTNWPAPPVQYAPVPQSHRFLLQTDPTGGQSPASFASYYQTPASSSLNSGGIVSSAELAQFPGYLNSLESPGLLNQTTPVTTGLPMHGHLTQPFGSRQMPPI